MHEKRQLEESILKKLKNNPVVAILGPRQCGKTTLAKKLLATIENSLYLDLESSQDRNQLNDLWAFFEANKKKTICLDEIQMMPEIFSQIRSFVDQQQMPGQFLILGSASRDLIQQSSETLAGRISYVELTPFRLLECSKKSLQEHWLQGGFPRSLLASDLESSHDWRKNYIRSFLERDLPQLGFRVPAQVLENFWKICAHSHGQTLHATKLAQGLGVTDHTIKRYLEILKETFMVRLLPPYSGNVKKRLIKSPKVYLRDSGLVHTLLSIESYNELLGHPVKGFSFEGFVIENLIEKFSRYDAFFYRTSKGEELDLVFEGKGQRIVFEIKASTTPSVKKGFWRALEQIKADQSYIIADVKESYVYQNNVRVLNLYEALDKSY